MERTKFVIAAVFIGTLLLIPSCAINPVTGKKQFVLMSEAQEIQLGRDYDPQVIATFGEYKSEGLQALIDKRGREMGLVSHRPNLQYTFKILDSPVINAFAVPGGYIYFTRGILAQFNNEAELMGVLGHEMGHITARHTVSQQSKQQLGQLILIGGMIASETFRKYGEYAMTGMQLLFLSFSRENEREADRLGVEYASKIRYDANKMADFYKVLIKMNLASEHGGVPTFMSTHPDPGDRYNAVKRDATKWQDSLKYPTWEVNTDSYLQLVDGMVYGEDPRQGYTEGNVFYHPDLKFRYAYPTGWKLENSPIQVRMAPDDGKALMVFTMAAQKTLDEAVQATLQQLQLNATVSKRTTVNGMPAVAVISTQVSQNQSTGQQQVIKAMSYFIDYAGMIYVFHGVTMDTDFDTYSRLFENSMLSFDKLTDPLKINVQPKRVKIKRVQQAATFAEACKALGVPTSQLEEISFLNHMELNDKVAPGTLIKTIGY